MIAIVTPWREHPELIADYERATAGARPIVVVNNTTAETRRLLQEMVDRNRGLLLDGDGLHGYGAWCNAGLAAAESEIIVCLNNDVRAVGDWLKAARQDILSGPSGLYGPELQAQIVAGVAVPFLSGWCIGAKAEVWQALRGYDTTRYVGNYWEDNDLCWRAVNQSFKLCPRPWPIVHLGNTTSRTVADAYSSVQPNKAAFHALVINGEMSECTASA